MKLQRQLFIWIALSLTTILFYQNCGQQGEIALQVDPAQLGGEKDDICEVNPNHSLCTNIAPIGKVEEYRYIDVKQPIIPDLKIFLVLDNSDSMRVSQVNLVNNIEKMFSENGDGLRDYNSEIFIITTAQLNNIGNKIFKTSIDYKNDYHKILEKLYTVQNSNLINSLLPFLRPLVGGVTKTNGLLAGDMVGFYAKSVRTPSSVAPNYDALEMNFYPAYLANLNQPSILSVKYSKGGSITELVNRLKERVELLNPDNQILSKAISIDNTTADNIPLSDVVEKESGLCALGRVVHDAKNNPSESLIKKGELAAFILVSDEEEHDVAGAECVKTFKYQQPLPGTLYKGVCADNEASVSYEVPDKRDWKLEVKQPYVKNIRQAQEHINGEILKVDGKCGVKFKQTHARLKVNKNTHKVNFSRKIVDSNGDTVVKSWTHDLNFNRVNKKHKYTFDRVSLSHKIVFDRINLKHKVSSTRKLTTPIFNLNVSRRLISQFQKVDYVRKTILTKEGNKKVEVASTGALSINIPGVNIVATECTPAWLAGRVEIKALEPALSSTSESYEYEVSGCVIANIVKTENHTQDYSGNKPTTCDATFAESIFPKSAMQSNDSYTYDTLSCTQKANNVVSLAITSADIAGDVSGVASCDASYASAKDSSKPAVNSAIGQVLSYESVSCASANSTNAAVQITGLAGNCSQVANLDTYVVQKDGNLSNVSYASKSCVDTNSSALAQQRTESGVYAGSNCVDSIKALESNLANTSYANCSVVAANVTDSNQTIPNISGKYTYTNDSDLLSYIRVKDGNKSVANTDYSLVAAGYLNKATYEDAVGLASASIDGKKPGTCDIAYASLKDASKPALSAGQSLVYYNVTCADNAPVAYQLVRAGKTIKYDGTFGNLLLAYDSSLSTSRVCSGAEKATILSNESSASPAMVPDGNVLEVSSCIVSNADLVSATTESNNILALVNADNSVKVGAASSVCDAPIASHCASGAANNPQGYLGCQNNVTSFVTHVAYKAEKRKYVLKAPTFDAANNELHWFGFEPLPIVKNSVPQNISLLTLTCEEVVGACGSSANDPMIVENYFKKTYAQNDNAKWSAIKKTSLSSQTVSDPNSLAIACVADAIKDYVAPSDSRKDYEVCNNKSVNASKTFDIVYDSVISNVIVTKNLNDTISCNEACTAENCKAKTGSRELIPYTVIENGATRILTMNEYYGSNCYVNPTYTASTQVSKRLLSKISLSEQTRDLAAYNSGADVCNLTCKDTGLCKAAANSAIDYSTKTVKQFVADLNAIEVSKIASCKVARAADVNIEDKVSKSDVENSCIRPAGSLLANKYIRNKNYITYYGALLPNGKNEVLLVKENQDSLSSYLSSSFAEVLGDGFVSMASFSSKDQDGQGNFKGKAYDDVAKSVNGVVNDVKSSSDQYGVALKFLGEKVAAQLKSSFQVQDVAPSQQITRVWYSSWFTKGKFVQLNPTDFSASSSTIVITNPQIVEKMKNEASFKFFVEIY